MSKRDNSSASRKPISPGGHDPIDRFGKERALGDLPEGVFARQAQARVPEAGSPPPTQPASRPVPPSNAGQKAPSAAPELKPDPREPSPPDKGSEAPVEPGKPLPPPVAVPVGLSVVPPASGPRMFQGGVAPAEATGPIEAPIEEELLDPTAENEQKLLDARRRKVGLLLVISVVAVCAVAAAVLLRGNDKKALSEQEDILSQFTKGQLKDTGDLSNRINRNKQQPITPAPLPKPEPKAAAATAGEGSQEAKRVEDKPSDGPSAPKTPMTGANPRGANFKKDSEIIAKYEEINPSAAAISPTDGNKVLPSVRSDPTVNNRAARSTFIPGGRPIGIEAPGSHEKKENFGLHDVKLKARLLFAVRSSASSKIVAESAEAAGTIPAGAKFFGSANFTNNRVYVNFDEVSIGGSKTPIQGTAIQGSDPGLAAEVIEISNQNQVANFAIGATRAGTQVLSEAGSQLAGGAVNSVVDPHLQDFQKDKEASKISVEYRVPAKTPFFIYFE